ncbi:hypothetical protein GQ602_003059 [Ophiocordyceps camponoti-floridani]|uniref:Uncharacterized protein n=1 Tax=Ophiocordyceps camponoti-floridani TaxID=2030778 RepID=A0A8H4VDX9_9HYPO|nr:hypothetical protein GQ602_003059 [Ophiocordyceps camponoti-floridani]
MNKPTSKDPSPPAFRPVQKVLRPLSACTESQGFSRYSAVFNSSSLTPDDAVHGGTTTTIGVSWSRCLPRPGRCQNLMAVGTASYDVRTTLIPPILCLHITRRP